MNKRDMSKYRDIPAQRLINMVLTKRIIQMVIAADYMANAHIMIIHYHRQHIGGGTVAAHQDHIIQLIVLDGYLALYHIFYTGLTGLRHF